MMLYVGLSVSLRGGKGTCKRQAARTISWREGEALGVTPLIAFCN